MRQLVCRLPLAAAVAVGVSVAIGLVGCGGGGGGGNERSGTLRVAITDQAGSAYAEVHIAISEVSVVPAGSGDGTAALPVIATFNPPRDVEIVALQFQHELLGSAVIPEGHYNQVRLVLAANAAGQDPVNYATLVSDPTTKIALRTPSGQQSGLKVLGQFDVVAGQPQTIVLDFDPDRAIVQAGKSGNYNLKPTGIRVSEVLDFPPGYGALMGTVEPSDAWDDAVVEAIPVDPAGSGATQSVSSLDGSFRLFLQPGDYALKVTATGFNEGDFGPFTVAVAADTEIATPLVLTVP